MLPKVATHILLHTSRAAAAAQNYTLRNVIGIQSSNAPSTTPGGLVGWNGAGSSSWNGHGPGPGGAKHNTGSRFYSGYSGPGRAITQANQSTATDTNTGHNDDTDDIRPRRIPSMTVSRPRPRRSSITFGSHERPDRAEALGVLKTIQFHQARTRHVLAEQLPLSSDLVIPSTPFDRLELGNTPSSPPRTLVRRNSTSASSVELDVDSPPLSPPPSPLIFTLPAVPLTDPAAPQTTLPPTPPPSFTENDTITATEFVNIFDSADSTEDFTHVSAKVMQMRSSKTNYSVGQYNSAIRALISTRPPGHPITIVLETYNDMLSKDLVPDLVTYRLLVDALARRHVEVNRVVIGLESRMKRRELINRTDSTRHDSDAEQLAQLKSEDNLTSAKALFDIAVQLSPRFSFPLSVYIELLRACAFSADIDGAIRIFSHIEKTDGKASISIYFQLMRAFINAKDFEGAKDVFEEYRAAAKENRIRMGPRSDRGNDNETINFKYLAASERNEGQRFIQVLLWNKMIETYFLSGQPENAIGLLEEMMDNNGGVKCTEKEIPPPSSATYTAFIKGFVESGDLSSALAWFERMLAQETAPLENPLDPIMRPPRPDQLAWSIMLQGLAGERMRDDLNRLFRIQVQIAERDGIVVRSVDRMLVFEVNHMYLISDPDISAEDVENTFNLLIDEVWELNSEQPGEATMAIEGIRTTMERLLSAMAKHQLYDRALDVIMTYAQVEKNYLIKVEKDPTAHKEHLFGSKDIRSLILSQTTNLLDRPNAQAPTLEFALRFADISRSLGLSIGPRVAPYYLHAYYQAKERGVITSLQPEHWGTLILSMISMERVLDPEEIDALTSQPEGFQYQGLLGMIDDLYNFNVQVKDLWSGSVVRLCSVMFESLGSVKAEELLAKLGDDWVIEARKISGRHTARAAVIHSSPTVEAPPDHKPVRHIDLYHGRFVDEWYPLNTRVTPEMALKRYKSGASRGVFPPPEIMGRLINIIGRKNNLMVVWELYKDTQAVLAALEHDKNWQSAGWYCIEDQMVTALAQGGDIDSAHVHRQRILEHGGVLSAEAYGSLIQSVKETTDDSSAALHLWYEAEGHGVVPNVYMYNTMISKLSKARKADFALELFQQMKANNVKPTSVTYGAVIAACCRVGDSNSAELLFEEMTKQQNFKPRHPPYNTMIQLYTQMKPNRERVMHYYRELTKTGIAPTAHTYKLLLDCHGTLEPVDMDAMQTVFQKIVDDPKMTVQGVHWSSLINAWGCVKKDLTMAQNVFDSIADHPSTKQSNLALPDAVTYEAMLNVLVTLRRPDLIQPYLDRFLQSGVHMTAYISNLLIKGFSFANNMEKAREIFESMEDAPVGVAAPGNHMPHETNAQLRIVPGAPVYREPSTWEAMFRAELGSGNRTNALKLLERFKARQFPPAVFNRISSIMHDDSIIPPNGS